MLIAPRGMRNTNETRTNYLNINFFIATLAFAEPSITDRSSKVISRLEVLNSLAYDCESALQIKGIIAAKSKSCDKYLTKIKGDFLNIKIGQECVTLMDWRESTRKLIASKSISSTDQLKIEMNSVVKACDTDSYDKKYPFLLKPLNTINALAELE